MSRDDPQLKLRLTEEMKDRVTAAARENGRSVNAEISHRLEVSFYTQSLHREIAAVIERHIRAELDAPGGKAVSEEPSLREMADTVALLGMNERGWAENLRRSKRNAEAELVESRLPALRAAFANLDEQAKKETGDVA